MMRKFLFSLVSLSLFSLLYLGVFSINVEAGGSPPPSIAPTAADCATVCTGVTGATPCDGTNSTCLCTTDTLTADCLGTDGNDVMCGEKGLFKPDYANMLVKLGVAEHV